MDSIFNLYIPEICGMGLNLKLDGFRLLYAGIATFMWIVSTVFSLEYMAHYKRKTRYYFFLILTYFATVGVFLSADLYTTFIFFEIMSLASYVWVAQDEKPASLRAAGTYLAVAIIGGLVMLMGIFMLYDITGTLVIDELTGIAPSGKLWAAGLCLLVGFGAKAGAFPLHIWLPKAHPVAPAPASALLSGILTKSGVFGVIILTCYIFSGSESWGALILILAVCTMFLGALLALFSIDLKRTLACSSVSQIGFILTGVGMAGLLGHENALALRGSLLHMVNHSLIKLVLFSAAGVVFMNIHSLDLNDIRGFGRRKPLLNAIFLMGSLGIGGIPLWNGYISKTLIHESIVEYTELIHEGAVAGMFTADEMKAIEWIFLVSGGFTVAYMTKLYICIFVEKNASEDIQAKYDGMKKYMNLPTTVVLTLSAILLPIMGIFAGSVMDGMADMASPFLKAGVLHEAIHYFAFGNIKGALISIAIGALIYVAVVRTLLMSNNWYADRWPKWLDLENGIYRPILLSALPFVFGTICRVLDSLIDWVVVLLRKTIYKDSPVKGELPEGTRLTHALGILAQTGQKLLNVFRKKKNRKHTDYVHRYAMAYETYRESSFIIARSMSFGLMLFCIGLVLTVGYIFVRKLFM